MQAVPPPDPYQYCVQSADKVTSLISVSGTADDIDKFFNIVKRYPQWKHEGDGSGTDGNRLVVLRGPSSLPYRDIGGLIYEAQRLGLAIVFTPSAPLCEDQER